MTVEKYLHVTESDYQAVAGPDWPSFQQFQTHVDVPEFVYSEIDSMLGADEKFDHPSFCVLPFYGMEYPQNTVCCVMKPNSDEQQVRQEMLAGLRPDACQHCWKSENAGLISDRQIKNSVMDSYSGFSIVKLYNRAKQGLNRVVSYKIDTSNVCNSTCVTCGSMASSSWGELERKYLNIVPNNWTISPEQADQLIDYQSAVSIMFRGGEPLLSDTNFYILEKLLEHNNDQCFISFVTNGSMPIPPRRREIIARFKNVNFCFSIDGVERVFEYMRYPLQWNRLLENIDFCRSKNFILSANYTVSNVNVYYYNQTISWFDQQQIPYRVAAVESPAHFQPTALPQSVKQIISSGYPELVSILSHGPNDDQNFERMKQVIARQDQWKGISIRDFLPEFVNLLETQKVDN